MWSPKIELLFYINYITPVKRGIPQAAIVIRDHTG
jgi:hypothetical protein